jgi:hypothetical protein
MKRILFWLVAASFILWVWVASINAAVARSVATNVALDSQVHALQTTVSKLDERMLILEANVAVFRIAQQRCEVYGAETSARVKRIERQYPLH